MLSSAVGAGGCAFELPDDSDGESSAVTGSELTLEGFTEPSPTPAARDAVLKRFAHVDASRVVPRDLLADALLFVQANGEQLKKPDVVTVVDFSRHSSQERMFVVDLKTGAVRSHVVAHGSGSDPGNTGRPTRFSNVPGSNASSLGYYVTAETYQGKNGRSLRLDGVSKTNSNARARAVVLHGARYVREGSSKQGRSWGCPAVAHDVKDELISAIAEGSVLYIALSESASSPEEEDRAPSPPAEEPKPPPAAPPEPSEPPKTTPAPPPAEPICVPRTAAEACATAARSAGVMCGSVSDGCGGRVDCDAVAGFGCRAGETCTERQRCEADAPTAPPSSRSPDEADDRSGSTTSSRPPSADRDDRDDGDDSDDESSANEDRVPARRARSPGPNAGGCSAAGPGATGQPGSAALLLLAVAAVLRARPRRRR